MAIGIKKKRTQKEIQKNNTVEKDRKKKMASFARSKHNLKEIEKRAIIMIMIMIKNISHIL